DAPGAPRELADDALGRDYGQPVSQEAPVTPARPEVDRPASPSEHGKPSEPSSARQDDGQQQGVGGATGPDHSQTRDFGSGLAPVDVPSTATARADAPGQRRELADDALGRDYSQVEAAKPETVRPVDAPAGHTGTAQVQAQDVSRETPIG